jgi:hypothetical protein
LTYDSKIRSDFKQANAWQNFAMRISNLIRPGLQLRLAVWFACIGGLALVVQYYLVIISMSEYALKLPGDVDKNHALVSEAYHEVFFLSLVIVLPLAGMAGILATFRIAGPVHSITTFFENVLRGERTAACKLRKGDQLNDLCDLANEVSLPMREDNKARLEESEDSLRAVA